MVDSMNAMYVYLFLDEYKKDFLVNGWVPWSHSRQVSGSNTETWFLLDISLMIISFGVPGKWIVVVKEHWQRKSILIHFQMIILIHLQSNFRSSFKWTKWCLSFSRILSRKLWSNLLLAFIYFPYFLLNLLCNASLLFFHDLH